MRVSVCLNCLHWLSSMTNCQYFCSLTSSPRAIEQWPRESETERERSCCHPAAVPADLSLCTDGLLLSMLRTQTMISSTRWTGDILITSQTFIFYIFYIRHDHIFYINILKYSYVYELHVTFSTPVEASFCDHLIYLQTYFNGNSVPCLHAHEIGFRKSSLFKSVCVYLHASEALTDATRPALVPPVPQLGSRTQYGACKLKLNSQKSRPNIDDTSSTEYRIAQNRSRGTQTDKQRGLWVNWAPIFIYLNLFSWR